ncbi:glycosyltransferase family 4 protein [Alistipes sp. An66]|uniref:glycosyltransferase family 4 protein n=1 Tax=Alistipes sp. An66 TaxID=1965650 RepID=UPI000B370D77|nr:glycosyltransferase family 4 protein [Alistipes sp. An66]OUN58401.1 lipopolysaccharide N-acetylglucosaminyltransferase [Alistipes sp. An66]
MKILLVHNGYGKYSGEESVVDQMAAMWTEHGHQVVQLRMSTAGSRDSFVGKIHGFLAGLYSPKGVREMRRILKAERPDVVNVHNLFPFISPAALFECKKAGVPVVMTVHNFRLICPTGLFMRNGKPCELCLERGNEWGCVHYNCEHSLLKSVGYAARNAVARYSGAYRKCVDRFACITDFQRQKLIQAGFDAAKMVVIPNAVVATSDYDPVIGTYVAFSGRLSREKGVDLIVEVARRHPEITFKFAGALRDPDIVENLPTNVTLVGYLHGEELNAFYKGAAFFVMASRWYEGFPMSILEAAQFGRPTIGPNHGGFTEIISEGDTAIGRLFVSGNVEDLERQVVALWNNPNEIVRLGEKAHDKLLREYSTEVIYQKWNDLIKSML